MAIPPKPPPTHRLWWLWGLIWSQAAGGTLLAFTIALTRNPRFSDDPYPYALASTVVIPLVMGIVQAMGWPRGFPLTRRAFWGQTTLNAGLMIASAAIVLHEGAVCLVMAAPLLWLLTVLGAAIGRVVLRSGPLRISIVPLMILLIVADSRAQHRYTGTVTTRMHVNASADVVARHITAFPRIDAPADFWLCRAGLPYPVETTAEGRFTGARRVCRFSGGIEIGERITTVGARSVAFDVVAQPRHPEISDHATLRWGRIAVEENRDGTATLVGTSAYDLHVFPAGYFHWWADHVIHGVHERVFDHIRTLAEQESRR